MTPRSSRSSVGAGRTATAATALLALTFGAGANYEVRRGDTASGIAARHGITVGELVAANDLRDPNRILAGQRLTLPEPTTSATPAGGSRTGARIEVRRGDTVSGIAARHGITVAELVAANDLRDPNRIRAGQRLTLPEPTTRATTAGRSQVGALIEEVARANGWSPAFVKAIAWQESGWNNDRVSSAGAVGIMQVMPATGDFVSRDLVGRQLDLDDPRDNVVAGVAFLQHLWELTDGDVELTLAGYYQGLRSVRQNGMFPSTERYIANVLALRERFR